MLAQFQRRHVARSLDHDQSGQTIIEFALIFLLILTLIFMMIEGFSLIYTYTVLADAANEGLRYAIVNSSNTSGAVAVAKQYAANSFHNTSAITVSVTCGGSCAPPDTVTVLVTYTYLPWITWILPHAPTLHAYAQGRTVN
jgi:Flp pilus assembly protein TadG